MKRILKHKDFLSISVIILSVFVFFYQFVLFGKLPIPADTITGLYHPFRDFYASSYPNGMPYKNFLVTDPVRQQYVWKELVVNTYKQGEIPIWNIYEMSGKPLLANFQSGAFYPLNIILFNNPFSVSWSVFIMLQLILAGIFMYCYLKSLNLSSPAVVLGTISWIFSGFFISWLEWGVVGHTILWLPLMLLAVNKILLSKRKKSELFWFFVLLFSLCSSFFAGHLQTFFYASVFLCVYTLCLWFAYGRKIIKLLPFLTVGILFITITSVQWAPTLQFIDLSGRSADQSVKTLGWFIPFQNLTQFVAPDYLGNPATLNYFGIFNYGEFIGYIGMGGLLFAMYGILFRRDKKTLFYSFVLAFSFIFVLQNPLSQLPFTLKIPFISTAQPTRLIVLICFSLSVLTALGFDNFIRNKSKIIIPILILGAVLGGLFGATYVLPDLYPSVQDMLVSRNNMKLPIALFILLALLSIAYVYVQSKKRLAVLILSLIILLSIFDLLRFGWKYTPFVESSYLFPKTSLIKFLQEEKGVFRIGTTDDRILIPNFSTAYGIQSVEGYDPLYTNNYGKFIASSERGDHSVEEPFGFNRTIRPRSLINSKISDFLNIKYVLSFDELNNPKYKKVMEEGTTKLFENLDVLPRVFFVENVKLAKDIQDASNIIHASDLSKTAVVSDKNFIGVYSPGEASITNYGSNKIEIKTSNSKEGFLVISDVYYPSFRATIDGHDAVIVPTNIAFRGIKVPQGNHVIIMRPGLF